MKLFIKNMECTHCRMVVKDELFKLGLHPARVEIGMADIEEPLSTAQHTQVKFALQQIGFELLEDVKSILVEKIKHSILDIIWSSEDPPIYNLSVHLSDTLKHNYVYMSNLFSERLGITIEKFYICQKVERVKEIINQEGLTLAEIAFKLHYSSPAHLSNQFKKVAGLTPSQFRQIKKGS